MKKIRVSLNEDETFETYVYPQGDGHYNELHSFLVPKRWIRKKEKGWRKYQKWKYKIICKQEPKILSEKDLI